MEMTFQCRGDGRADHAHKSRQCPVVATGTKVPIADEAAPYLWILLGEKSVLDGAGAPGSSTGTIGILPCPSQPNVTDESQDAQEGRRFTA